MKRVNVFGYRVSQDDFERLLYFFTEYYKKKKSVRAHTKARVLLYKILYTITIKHQKGGGETYSIWRNAPDDIFDRLKVLQVRLDQLLNDFEEPILAKIDKILRSAERGVWEIDLETGRLLTFVPQAQQIYVNVDEEELKDVGCEAEIEEKINRIVKEYDLHNESDLILVDILKDLLYEIKQNPHDTKLLKALVDIYSSLGIERSKRAEEEEKVESGTVADLVKLYDEYVSSGDWLELEKKWREEEIALLLRKLDRKFPETNEPELTPEMFQIITGLSVEEAKKIVENPYDDKYGNKKFE